MPLNKRSDVVVDQSIELVARTNEPSEEAIVNLVQKQEEEASRSRSMEGREIEINHFLHFFFVCLINL